jgi:hypothetical protein
VNELGLRFRVFADDLPFLGQVNFNVEVFQRYAIAEIPIQAVCFLDQHNAAQLVIAQKPHHLAELLSACSLGRLHVYKFAQDIELVALRVFPEKFQLRGNRKNLRAPGPCSTLSRTKRLVSCGPLPARVESQRVPLTLPRFYFRVNGSRALAVSIPFVQQKKQRAQGEQIVGSEGFPSCGPLDALEMRQVVAVGSRAHG